MAITSRTEFIDVAELVALRRDIHAHPELPFEERRTSDLIASTLNSWDIPVHRGLGRTGVVGTIQNGNGRSIGLRADMDCLPISEQNRFSHASVYQRKMHACGHDGHVAMLLAAAKYLSRSRDFNGTVYLIFQPGEEEGGGAKEMIRDGLFDCFPMEVIFGAHNWPGLPVGRFAVTSGPVFASSSNFSLLIRGRGSHAAMPHEGIDPVLVACQVVQAFQTIISRTKRPADAAVISITKIHAGEALNAIPESCRVQGTVRTFTLDVLDMIETRMRQLAGAICYGFGATCELSVERVYPPTINHSRETEFVRRQLGVIVGSECVDEFVPTMGSEDFGLFLNERPGCYFVIGNGSGEHRATGHGTGPCNLHNSSYDFNDELISLGGLAWAHLVEAWLTAAPPH